MPIISHFNWGDGAIDFDTDTAFGCIHYLLNKGRDQETPNFLTPECIRNVSAARRKMGTITRKSTGIPLWIALNHANLGQYCKKGQRNGRPFLILDRCAGLV
jgi:hypothetical protein